jgi:hypothetical protein
VQRRDRLAGGCPRVGLQRPPEPAVGVAVAREHRQRGCRVAAADGQLGPAPVEQSRVSGDEVENPVEFGHAADDRPPILTTYGRYDDAG